MKKYIFISWFCLSTIALTNYLISTAWAENVEIISSGNLDISQSWTVDFDNGKVGAESGSDLWFEVETPNLRYLTPKNRASLAVIGESIPDFDNCRNAFYIKKRISVKDVSVGSWLCVKTNEGRFTRFKITENIGQSPRILRIFYATFEKIRHHRIIVSGNIDIPQTWLVDLDKGELGKRDNADLWFEANTATLRFITPQNGATLSVLENTKPNLSDCKSGFYINDRISVRDVSEGTWLCIKTNQRRYSRVLIKKQVGKSPGILKIYYETWGN